MTTSIHFEYNKEEKHYACGMKVDGQWIPRCSGLDKERVFKRFIEDLEQLESEGR